MAICGAAAVPFAPRAPGRTGAQCIHAVGAADGPTTDCAVGAADGPTTEQ